MSKKLFLSTLMTILVTIVSFSAFAQENAQVYVVHGIPGADIGAAASLPVDVSVSGTCAIKNFKFGDIAGPVALPAGKITVQISLASAANPCGGAVAIGPATFKLDANENATIIAYLKADGTPSARKYTNDASKTSGGRARITVHHTAAAPGVDVTIAPKVQYNQMRNGERFTVESNEGTAQVSIAPAGSQTPVFGPIGLQIDKSTRYLVYAVGSVAKNTFTLLVKTY